MQDKREDERLVAEPDKNSEPPLVLRGSQSYMKAKRTHTFWNHLLCGADFQFSSESQSSHFFD